MEEVNNEETFFREIMLKSKLDVPFPDFDDKVMELVEISQKHRSGIKRDVRH